MPEPEERTSVKEFVYYTFRFLGGKIAPGSQLTYDSAQKAAEQTAEELYLYYGIAPGFEVVKIGRKQTTEDTIEVVTE